MSIINPQPQTMGFDCLSQYRMSNYSGSQVQLQRYGYLAGCFPDFQHQGSKFGRCWQYGTETTSPLLCPLPQCNSWADYCTWYHYTHPPRCSGQPCHCQNMPGIPCQQTLGARGCLQDWQPHHTLHQKLLLWLQMQRQNTSFQIHAVTWQPLHSDTHLPWMLRIHPQTSQQPQHLPWLLHTPTKMICT